MRSFWQRAATTRSSMTCNHCSSMAKKGTIFARILFVLYLAAVAYLCFGKFDDLPHVSRYYFGIPTDKIVHFAMFFPFPILAYYAIGHVFKHRWTSILFIVILFLVGCLIAGGTELGQSMTTYRTCDPKDFKADVYALASCSLITLIINTFKHYKQ